VEAHGPHLPLATDVIIAETMARAAAARLAARGHDVVLLPPLAYTAADFAAGFPGTVSLRPATVTALLVDLARSLARHGLRVLAVANAHLDPAHLAAIEAAAAQTRPDTGARIVFPDVTKKPWAQRLTEEFRSGACHAGRYETSIVMAACPELVRESLRRSLPPNPRALGGAGAAVVVAARTLEAIEAVATELRAAGGQAWAVACDVTDPASVAALARAAESHLEHVDILVNNAGVSHSAPLQRITLAD